MATARPTLADSKYWDQFYSAITCGNREQCEAWMDAEISRYERTFKFNAVVAWQTIVCNLAFFAGYYGSDAVRKIHANFGGLDPCFLDPGFTQAKRSSMSGSETIARDSPV